MTVSARLCFKGQFEPLCSILCDSYKSSNIFGNTSGAELSSNNRQLTFRALSPGLSFMVRQAQFAEIPNPLLDMPVNALWNHWLLFLLLTQKPPLCGCQSGSREGLILCELWGEINGNGRLLTGERSHRCWWQDNAVFPAVNICNLVCGNLAVLNAV